MYAILLPLAAMFLLKFRGSHFGALDYAEILGYYFISIGTLWLIIGSIIGFYRHDIKGEPR